MKVKELYLADYTCGSKLVPSIVLYGFGRDELGFEVGEEDDDA